MTDILAPQAGWYPDPTDNRAYRWWSGGAWTDHLTAAPSAEAVWASEGGRPTAIGAEVFDLAEQGESPFSSSFEQAWSAQGAPRDAGRNRAGLVIVVIGVVAVVAYLGSMALAYSTIIPLIPGAVGLIGAVPAFRRARITGEGLAISLLGVLLSGAATVLSVLPLLPMLLGVPSASDVNKVNQTVASVVSFHSKVETQLVADAKQDFGQTATAAACPTDIGPIAGSTFSCTLTLADATTGVANVTVTDDAGTITEVAAAK